MAMAHSSTVPNTSVELLPLPASSNHNLQNKQESALLRSMSSFLVRVANGILEPVLKRTLVPLSENSHLKKLVLQKDLEILRLRTDIQKDKDDIEAKGSKISELERDIATVNRDIQSRDTELAQLRTEVQDTKDNIRFREERLASLQGEIMGFRDDVQNRDNQFYTFRTEIDNFRITLNVKDEEIVSLQHEVQDVRDALRARDERITSLMKVIEEERGRTITKDEQVSKAEEMLKLESLMRELDESRRKEGEMTESQQRLAVQLEERETEMENTLADWEARYDVLHRAREDQVEAQRALEEQLENNNTELDRLLATLSEREQALS